MWRRQEVQGPDRIILVKSYVIYSYQVSLILELTLEKIAENIFGDDKRKP